MGRPSSGAARSGSVASLLQGDSSHARAVAGVVLSAAGVVSDSSHAFCPGRSPMALDMTPPHSRAAATVAPGVGERVPTGRTTWGGLETRGYQSRLWSPILSLIVRPLAVVCQASALPHKESARRRG